MKDLVEAYEKVILESAEADAADELSRRLKCSLEEVDAMFLRLVMRGLEEASIRRVAVLASSYKYAVSLERVEAVCEAWRELWSGSELLAIDDIRSFDELKYATDEAGDYESTSQVCLEILHGAESDGRRQKIVSAVLWNMKLSATSNAVRTAYICSHERHPELQKAVAESFLARMKSAKSHDELKQLADVFNFDFVDSSNRDLLQAYDDIAGELIARKDEFMNNDWLTLFMALVDYCGTCCAYERPGRRDEAAKVCYEALERHRKDIVSDIGILMTPARQRKIDETMNGYIRRLDRAIHRERL